MHLAAHLRATAPGQHQIQDDQVELARQGQSQSVLAVVRSFGVKAVEPQRMGEPVGEVALVFDDENARGRRGHCSAPVSLAPRGHGAGALSPAGSGSFMVASRSGRRTVKQLP